MDGFLQGKVAIVTGAARGMGEATALAFAAAGAKVLAADIDGEAGQATADAIGAAGGEAAFLRTDVSDEDAVRALVEAAVEHFGRLDCAVNNAAIKPDQAPVAEADIDTFDHVVAINLRSVVLCDKYEIRQMLAQGDGGAIVNIASTSSVRVQPETVAYNAAKHGVIGVTKTAALEVTGEGIRVNAVIPGAIDTPMLRTALDEINMSEADYAPILSLFNRFGRPEEVAQASLWLCSDLSSYTTGHALAVDGGYLAR
jgi:glucose 1-dehydrogenase